MSAEWQKNLTEHLQLKGLAERSVETYVFQIQLLSKHYGYTPPCQLSEEQVRCYFLKRRNQDQVAAGTLRILYSAIKHFYSGLLKQHWSLLKLIYVRQPRKFPVVLSQPEVHALLGAVRPIQHKTFLWTVYSMGLRTEEARHLRPADIDSFRMMAHIRNGKGGKERYVPLPEITLKHLHTYWDQHRNPHFLFPGSPHSQRLARIATRPMAANTVYNTLRASLAESGIMKKVSLHTFRHSYATHLLESGVHVRILQHFLGHSRLDQTIRYLHLTHVGHEDAIERINSLMNPG